MCGIAGFWANHPSNFLPESTLENMVSSLDHRGPDSSGLYLDDFENLGLCHARLSILDLSLTGHQPMFSESEKYILVYNGEIYNHNEIRLDLELERIKKNWRGSSDTETLLEAIDCWGLNKAIRKCKGMFAFALWQKKQKKLFLVRDRMGEKPLYFFQDNKKIIFGSELKAIRSFPVKSLEINSEAVQTLFETSYVKDPNSIYSNIYKVPPGNIVEFSSPFSDPKIYSFWSLEKLAKKTPLNTTKKNSERNFNHIHQLLKDVISSQMISDVPLGSFLSGGIDSSLVTSIMQSIETNKVKTFSIGFEQDEYNEAKFAEDIANYLDTDHKSFYISELDALSVIPKLAEIYDEPFADYSQIPTILLCREASKHVTVALTGDGGDEVFGGYNRYIFAPRVWKYISKFPQSIRKQVKFIGKAAHFFSNNQNNFINSIVKYSGLPMSSMDRLQHLSDILGSSSNFESLFHGLTSTFQENEKPLLDKPKSFKSNSFEISSEEYLSLSRQMMLEDSKSYLPGDILTKVDRASMSASMETRAPFLDQRIVEAAWLLPDHQLFQNRIGKFILREILSTYIPRNLFERPKQGFTIPIDNWLRNDLKEWGDDLLASDKIKFFGLLDENEVSKLWNEHQSKKSNHGHKLWTILMFQLWLEQWSN